MRVGDVSGPRARALAVATCTVVGLLGLTACSASSSSAADPTAAGSAATSSASAGTTPSVGTTPMSSPSGTPASTPAASGGLTVVPTAPVSTAPAVPIGTPATVGGVTVSIGAVTAFTGAAVAPGELGGPAVAVPVTLRNGTGAAVSAAGVVVDLVRADGSPASPLTGDPAAPVSGTVAPGASVTGVYAFTLAADARSAVSITVSYRTGVPVASFTGSVAS